MDVDILVFNLNWWLFAALLINVISLLMLGLANRANKQVLDSDFRERKNNNEI